MLAAAPWLLSIVAVAAGACDGPPAEPDPVGVKEFKLIGSNCASVAPVMTAGDGVAHAADFAAARAAVSAAADQDLVADLLLDEATALDWSGDFAGSRARAEEAARLARAAEVAGARAADLQPAVLSGMHRLRQARLAMAEGRWRWRAGEVAAAVAALAAAAAAGRGPLAFSIHVHAGEVVLRGGVIAGGALLEVGRWLPAELTPGLQLSALAAGEER